MYTALLLLTSTLLSAAAAVDPPRWTPPATTTWEINIGGNAGDDTLADSYIDSLQTSVLILDLELASAATIARLHSRGMKAICYFSAGTYEHWRGDAGKFKEADKGTDMGGGWDERWVDYTRTNVRSIMKARLDSAKQKGCDAVDPDNIDGFLYPDRGGVGLTEEKAAKYVKDLAAWAHQRGMSCGLKNGVELVEHADVVEAVDFQVNEQCIRMSDPENEYYECTGLAPFIEAGKPVFHIEYPLGQDNEGIPSDALIEQVREQFCNDPTAEGFMTLLKDRLLTSWSRPCWESS